MTVIRRKTPMQRRHFTASAVSQARARIGTNLTKLCRKLVVELRDDNTCQRCGKRWNGPHSIEWAHVKTRNAQSLIYVPWNSLALCGPKRYAWSCHYWWHSRVGEAMGWWRDTFTDRAVLLEAWEHAKRHPPIDRAAERLWLENAIREREKES